MEVLLGPLLPYILGFLAVVGALFAAFFKGRSSANKQAELDTLRATRDAQVRVGEAQAKDADVDAEAKRKAQEARDKPDEGGRRPDGTFRL
jgi:hypothetical protein